MALVVSMDSQVLVDIVDLTELVDSVALVDKMETTVLVVLVAGLVLEHQASVDSVVKMVSQVFLVLMDKAVLVE